VAFPATKLGLMVELALAADLTAAVTSWAWTNITSYVKFAEGITITRGRPDEFTPGQPAKVQLALLNDGRFVIRNPTGAYYGQIGKNTPLRVLVRPDVNTASDAFGRTTSNGFGAADVGGTWQVNGTASEYSTTGSAARLTLASAATRRYAVLPTATYLTFDETVRIRTTALATGAPLSAGILWHYSLSSDNNRYELIFNTDQTIGVRAVARVGSVETVGPTVVSGLTHVANTWYRVRAQSTAADVTAIRLKVWLDGTTEPATWTIHNTISSALNGSAGKVGLTGTREAGNTNANAVIEFDDYGFTDGWFPRHTGYVDEWPTRWNDAGLKQMLAPITASGITRRLGQGKILSSAIKRGVLTAGATPKAYWPCEDASTSTSLASGLPAGLPMRISGAESLGTGQATGSAPVMVVNNTGLIRGTVQPYSGTDWSVMWLINIPSAPAGEQALMRWLTSGTYLTWQLVLTPGSPDTIQLRAYDASNTERLADVGASVSGIYGTQLWIEVSAQQVGSDVNWMYTIWMFENSAGKAGTKTGITAGTVTEVAFGNGAGADQLSGSMLGHISAWDTAAVTLGAFASVGWSGEAGWRRFQRLAAEESVTATVATPVTGDVATMGAPTLSTLLSQVREIETAEQGIAYDEVDGSLALLLRERRFNQTVALTLDVSQHQVAWPIEPADNDQQIRNDVTSSRPGSTVGYRHQDTTSANSVSRIGFYSTTRSVNLSSDEDLRFDAEFAVALGTIDEIRYPTIPIDLTRSPSLISSWLNTNVGNRLQITHAPSTLTPDTIDLIVEGYTERFDTEHWTAVLNTSSARPWNAFIVETGTGNQSRVDSSSSTLAAGVSNSATSLSVATSIAADLWTTGVVNFDIEVAGERMTVTNISGSSSPQTFTVVRSINGVVKAQTTTDGRGQPTKVSLWRPNTIGL
jgi:hypothetical protein